MTDEEFERLVAEGVDSISERYQKKINNVAVVIADAPTEEQLKANHVPLSDTLLGLYEGIPLTERGEYYGIGAPLPDKITIFKKPILEEANGDTEFLKEVIRDTLWHEFAHYFGYGDEEIEKREAGGANHLPNK